jgi:DNA-binding transcriptional regulator YdaS (Cro superfamily)
VTDSKFAEVVDPLLAELNWSHSNLADSLEVSPACVSRWFSGKRKVHPRHVAAIARVLGTSVSKLSHDLGVAAPIEPSSYAALEVLRNKADARAELAEASLARMKREQTLLEGVVRALHKQLSSVEADREILSAKLRARSKREDTKR